MISNFSPFISQCKCLRFFCTTFVHNQPNQRLLHITGCMTLLHIEFPLEFHRKGKFTIPEFKPHLLLNRHYQSHTSKNPHTFLPVVKHNYIKRKEKSDVRKRGNLKKLSRWSASGSRDAGKVTLAASRRRWNRRRDAAGARPAHGAGTCSSARLVNCFIVAFKAWEFVGCLIHYGM